MGSGEARVIIGKMQSLMAFTYPLSEEKRIFLQIIDPYPGCLPARNSVIAGRMCTDRGKQGKIVEFV